MANEDFTAETKTRRIDICNSHNIMVELWERTSHTLTDKELKWFSQATEHAEQGLLSLKQTLESIGCLVLNEESLEAGKRSGNFQSSNDVPDLLFAIANYIENIQGLIHVGSSADARLKHPERYRSSDDIKSVK
ncbi:hypothetical protein [Nitrosomonas ureae]|uniref:Uncharacterized protein n=1 Tax=Nitrosomonas ureae TaxID=44577 RepID=A0A1H5XU52_9PROT|nr:hypothetical protein [Nitrosomonas ureae]SEG15208.1 hypothetical protein SAMN05216334_1323 [Nitrosomonas ureae]